MSTSGTGAYVPPDGYVVLRRDDAERMLGHVPNGCGEPSRPFWERMQAVLAAQTASDRGDLGARP